MLRGGLGILLPVALPGRVFVSRLRSGCASGAAPLGSESWGLPGSYLEMALTHLSNLAWKSNPAPPPRGPGAFPLLFRALLQLLEPCERFLILLLENGESVDLEGINQTPGPEEIIVS